MKPRENFTQIRKILQWVWENPYSSFYRDKYKKAGIKSWKEIKNMEDFKKLPYLTREEIAAVDPFDRIFVPKKKVNIVTTTTGTTNKPLVFFNEIYDGSNPEILSTGRKESLKYFNSKKLERMLFLETPRTLRVRIQYYNLFKNICYVFGDVSNLPLSAKTAAATKIDSISASSTILLFFIPYLRKEYDLKKIRCITMGGEYCSKQRLKLLKKAFPNAEFHYHYGSTEATNRGYICKEQISKDPNVLHWDPTSYPEITEEGELVMTSYIRTVFPLIRYKTGDSIKFKDKLCACGKKDPVFEILGRLGYDSVNIQGVTIHVKSVMSALKDVPGIISEDFRLNIYELIEGEKIVARLVLELIKKDKKTSSAQKIGEIISNNLYLTGKITLSDLVKKGIFKPLEVKLVDELPFEAKRKYIILHK